MPGTTAATTHRALLLVKCALVAATLPPDARYEYADWSTKLQEDLLAGYNRHVVPKSDRSKQGTTFSAAGTNVEMALRIFKVIAVKPADGAMELKALRSSVELAPSRSHLFSLNLSPHQATDACAVGRCGSACTGRTNGSHGTYGSPALKTPVVLSPPNLLWVQGGF